MLESELRNILRLLKEANCYFALWSLPESQEWRGILQNDHNEERFDSFDRDGFVIRAFEADSAALIRNDHAFSGADDLRSLEKLDPVISNSLGRSTDKSEYEDGMQKVLSRLRDGELEKVVISRVERSSCSKELSEILLSLREKYPQAMVFCYHYKGNTWFGASPETFLEYQDGRIKTMALAGSRSIADAREWTSKEIEEHAFVERYIEENIKQYDPFLIKTGPFTKAAGPVEHICSVYEARIGEDNILTLVDALHPTPAVCGIAVDKAKEVIRNTEEHQRFDYTGYFGPVFNKDLKLFVNLRSARYSKGEALLYLGGGITKDSTIEDEWKETEIKAQTLLSIL